MTHPRLWIHSPTFAVNTWHLRILLTCTSFSLYVKLWYRHYNALPPRCPCPNPWKLSMLSYKANEMKVSGGIKVGNQQTLRWSRWFSNNSFLLLLKFSSLKQYMFIFLQFWISEGQNQFHWAKIKMFVWLIFTWSLWMEIPFSCLLVDTCIPWIGAPSSLLEA